MPCLAIQIEVAAAGHADAAEEVGRVSAAVLEMLDSRIRGVNGACVAAFTEIDPSLARNVVDFAAMVGGSHSVDGSSPLG